MRGPGERHTAQGLARGQWAVDEYDAELDRGSYHSGDRRELARKPGRRLPVITGAPVPCRLCQPAGPCSFHEDTAVVDELAAQLDDGFYPESNVPNGRPMPGTFDPYGLAGRA